ncbi:MAG: sulfurtransferase TusA family protein [Oscillospiraceae bacterium]
MFKIDACGRSCPEPVVMLKKAVDNGENPIEVTVDNNTAKENIVKFFSYAGFTCNVTENSAEEEFVVTGNK